MRAECISDQYGFEGFDGRRVVAAFDGGAITTDAGALLLRHTDRAIGLFGRVAACFGDHRVAERTVHGLRTMVGQRIAGIALGYEDLDDHDELRHDPVLALLSDRLEPRRQDCAALAGKSTLNRLEHAPAGAPTRYHKIGHDGRALADLFVDLYLEAHERAPGRIILDLDATDDPIHGHQEGRFFHGCYDCHCYPPLYIFAGRHLLAAKLRRSDIDGAAGSRQEVARIVGQIRRRWPRADILLRGDSGFARENLMAWCEDNGVGYLFGLARNERLVTHVAGDLEAARAEHAATGDPARRFADFMWSTLDSWSRRRRVVAKAEHMNKGANQLRLWFAAFAYVLLDSLRRLGLKNSRLQNATLRHHPPQAAQTRRPGHGECPAHQDRHDLGPSMAQRIRPGPRANTRRGAVKPPDSKPDPQQHRKNPKSTTGDTVEAISVPIFPRASTIKKKPPVLATVRYPF